jgi:hypothetical protein
MTELENLLIDPGTTSRAIQMWLREIDAEVLAKGMAGMGRAGRERVLENMSQRAGGMLSEMIPAAEKTAGDKEKTEAQSFLRDILQRMIAEGKSYAPPPEKVPVVKLDSPADIVESFGAMAAFVRDFGVLGLEKVKETTTHPLLKKGLMYLVDGWDPMWAQSMLENLKAHHLKRIETEFDMILEGISLLYQANPAGATKEKLKSICGLD